VAMEDAVKSLLKVLSEGGDEKALDNALVFIEYELGYCDPSTPAGELLFSQEAVDIFSKALDNDVTAEVATATCHTLLQLVAYLERERTARLVTAPNIIPRLVADLGKAADNVFISRSSACVLAALAEHSYAEEVAGCGGVLDAASAAIKHGLGHEPSSFDAEDEGETQRKDAVKPCLELLKNLMANNADSAKHVASHPDLPQQVVDVASSYGSPSMIGEFYSMLEYIGSLLKSAGAAVRMIIAAMAADDAAALLKKLKEGLEAKGRGVEKADEWNATARGHVLAGLYPDEPVATRNELLEQA